VDRHRRLREVVGADQLVVAREGRPEVRRVRAVAELAAVDRQPVPPTRPPRNDSGCGGAGSRGRATKNGLSGQMPVSITPTTTLLPALSCPPSVGQTFVAPMKLVLSSSGWLTASRWTATTPRTERSFAILFAGTRAATPPETVEDPVASFARGMARLSDALMPLALVPAKRS